MTSDGLLALFREELVRIVRQVVPAEHEARDVAARSVRDQVRVFVWIATVMTTRRAWEVSRRRPFDRDLAERWRQAGRQSTAVARPRRGARRCVDAQSALRHGSRRCGWAGYRGRGRFDA